MNEFEKIKRDSLRKNRLKEVKKLQKIINSEKEFVDMLRYALCPDPVDCGDSHDPYDERYLDLCEALLIFKKIRRIDDELTHSREDK